MQGYDLAPYQYLFQDLIFCTLTAIAMGVTRPAPQLLRQSGAVRVFSLRVMAPVVLQVGLSVAFIMAGYGMLRAQPWYQVCDVCIQ